MTKSSNCNKAQCALCDQYTTNIIEQMSSCCDPEYVEYNMDYLWDNCLCCTNVPASQYASWQSAFDAGVSYVDDHMEREELRGYHNLLAEADEFRNRYYKS